MIKFIIGSPFEEDGNEESKKEPQMKISLNARKTVDGNLLIYDHPEIDIAIIPGGNKIVTFPKNLLTNDVYEAQNKLFKFLARKGVIVYDSVQGGNVYGSVEAKYPDNPAEGVGSPMQLLILVIAKFLDDAIPGRDFIKALKDDYAYDLTDPDMEHSTEFGEVPQAREKGSMKSIIAPYNAAYKAF